jgi:glycosyltransferase involved in cell wall biosynthesis
MIRICHLITDLDAGGAERMLVNIITCLDPTRFSNEVISMIEPGILARELRAAGIPVVSLGMRRGLPTFSGFSALVRHLRRRKPTILQTWLYHADFLGTLASQFAPHLQMLWNLRCSDIVSLPTEYRMRWIVRLLAGMSRLPNAVIVNSERGRSFHEDVGYRPRRWVVIPNGVDVDRFHPNLEARVKMRTSLGVPLEGQVIGMVARHHPMKDHATFLRAAAVFTQGHPDVYFVLCGEGCHTENEALARPIAELGLTGRVILLGTRGDMENIYPAFDLLTLSSALGEGFPNVLIESMACGVPCVATDVGDSCAIVGDCGLVVAPRDPVVLAEGWENIINRRAHPFSERARARAIDKFSLNRICLRYESVYEEVSSLATTTRKLSSNR